MKFDNNNQLNSLQQKEYNAFIKKTFGNCVAIKSILEYIRFNKIGEILNYLIKETKYGKIFSSMSINDFLNSRIRIQINYINPILNDLENNKWNEYEAGTEIAAANNATQNVKPDDLFGNKNKKELEEYIFKNFTKQYKDSVKIEYRYGEIIDKSSEKAHILTLLRPIIATGILTKEKDIYTFTNQRAPIYIVYEKLLTKTSNAKSTIDAVAKLISLLYKIRVDYVSPTLEKHKRDLIRDYKKKAVSGELTETIINDDIRQAGSDDDKIEKIIKSNVNYNIEHILPVLIFRIRRLFIEDNNQNIKLTVEDDKVEIFLTSIIKAIYDSYVKLKLSGLPTSLTTELRSSKFYEFGFETYNALKDVYQFNETDFIEKNKHIIN